MYKYVVFGAGHYGRMALEFYGKDKVSCFIDNNINKENSIYCDKKVVSFEKYLEGREKSIIVVAVDKAEVIVEQLREYNIYDYFVFKPEFYKIREFIQNNSIASMILCGRDNSTEGIIDILDQFNLKRKIRGIVRTKYDDEYEYPGIEIINALKDVDAVDCYMISSFKYHMALTVLLEEIIRRDSIFDPYYKRRFYDTEAVVVNSYEEKGEIKSEQEWNREIETKNKLRDEIREYVECSQWGTPIFEYIEIETINRCNGSCSFCPVNVKADPREKEIMNEWLFEKIINELSTLKYNGHICLFSNNEPLLDSRIFDFCAYARKRIPNAYIYLYTNGTLFTLEKFKKLIDNLDELIIDNYSLQHTLIKPVSEIVELIKDNIDLRKKVTVIIRDPEEILTSRGGEAPNRKAVISFKGDTCTLPFRQIVVRPDGKVSLCCNDPLGRETLGDLNEQSLIDVWYGDKYKEVRRLISGGRENISHCVNCDTFYLF